MENLSPEERLAILRGKDATRSWHSLDDQRVCVLCHRLITGREIRITSTGDGQHEVHCPSEGCEATPRDWFSYGSAQSSNRPSAEHAPQKVEMDLDFQ